jgi:glycosyltransferase involved in cell wall biosynthesis
MCPSIEWQACPQPKSAPEDSRLAIEPRQTVRPSVVIPVGRWDDAARDQVRAVAGQVAAADAELIVVDNAVRCCADRIAVELDGMPSGVVLCAHELRSPAHARTRGAAAAAGDVVVFVDADDLVTDRWLHAILGPFADKGVGIVGGALDEKTLNGERLASAREQLTPGSLPVGFWFLPYAPSGNLAVRADLLRAADGFCCQMVGAEDIDFSWRVQSLGVGIAFAPDALSQVRHRRAVLASLRQGYRWGRGGAWVVRVWQDRPPPRPRLPSYRFRGRQLGRAAGTAYRARSTRPLLRHLSYQVGLLAGGALDRSPRFCRHHSAGVR